MIRSKSIANLIVIILSYFICSASTYAISFDQVIVFGDSLSDNGNVYSLTSKINTIDPYIPIVPKNPPYHEGRFTNGNVWVEELANAFNAPLYNYAYGGSWVEPVYDSGQTIPFDLSSQINMYLFSAATDFNKSKHLFVIWSGSNDYSEDRDDHDYATSNTVSIIKNQIEWLIYYGANYFLIPNIPDLSLVPKNSGRDQKTIHAIHELSLLHNQRLAQMIAEERKKYPDVKFIELDIQTKFTEMVTNPHQFSLKNSHDPCYEGSYSFARLALTPMNEKISKQFNINIEHNPALKTAYQVSQSAENGEQACADPDTYLFWDKMHPTKMIHHLIALYALKTITEYEHQA